MAYMKIVQNIILHRLHVVLNGFKHFLEIVIFEWKFPLKCTFSWISVIKLLLGLECILK